MKHPFNTIKSQQAFANRMNGRGFRWRGVHLTANEFRVAQSRLLTMGQIRHGSWRRWELHMALDEAFRMRVRGELPQDR